MTCPDAPHVHKTLECPACFLADDYVMLKPEEAVDCKACGFELHVPEDFQKYARDLFEAADRARKERPSKDTRDQLDAFAYMMRPGGRMITFPVFERPLFNGDEVRLEITPDGFQITVNSAKRPWPLDWLDGLA